MNGVDVQDFKTVVRMFVKIEEGASVIHLS